MNRYYENFNDNIENRMNESASSNDTNKIKIKNCDSQHEMTTKIL